MGLRHSYFERKFGGTLKGKKETKKMKIWLFFHTFFNILRFGGTPWKFNGTLVEKHCSKAFRKKSNYRKDFTLEKMDF
jgi:hypothetical protein